MIISCPVGRHIFRPVGAAESAVPLSGKELAGAITMVSSFLPQTFGNEFSLAINAVSWYLLTDSSTWGRFKDNVVYAVVKKLRTIAPLCIFPSVIRFLAEKYVSVIRYFHSDHYLYSSIFQIEDKSSFFIICNHLELPAYCRLPHWFSWECVIHTYS